MKIISHNINGLQAYVKSGKLARILLEDADVYCFQEVKVSSQAKLDELLQDITYDYAYCYSQNVYKKGYAGVMTMVKKSTCGKLLHDIEKPEDTTTILEGMSNYGWGRIVTAKFDDFYIINVYVLNSGNKDDERVKFDNRLQNYLLSLDKPYIVCGDFNVCHSELDYHGNWKRAINSMPGLKEYEIEGFDKLMTFNGLRDCYREMHPFTRKYSWCSPRTKNPLKGWRLDYFLASAGFNIKMCDVMQGWNRYDHSPIVLEI